jgi:raffinose/stachyose/melibiose transport system permease protein
MQRLRNLSKPTAIHIFLLVVTLVNVFPLYYMVTASLKTNEAELVDNELGLPISPTLEHFAVLPIEKGFLRMFFNSAVVTLGSVAGALVVACLAAYALARMNFWGRQVLLDFITALMAVPVIVVVIPVFVVMSNLQLINRYPSAVIMYIGFILPFAIFILTSFFRSVAQELLDAAKIDGASDLVLLVRIIIPLAKAPLATLAIVNGLWVWNELLIAMMFLQREEMKTLMAGIALFSGRNVRNIPLIMAASMLASLPTLFLLVAGQRTFVKGLTSGSLK